MNHPSTPQPRAAGAKRLNVLVACEFSGTVRDAFAALGHNAWSCDLLPCESDVDGNPNFTGKHFQYDAIKLLANNICPDDARPWDLLIGHPPCTFLCNSGVRWLDKGKNGKRMAEMILACHFFNDLLGESLMSAAREIPHICVENPIQHSYARERIRKQDQIIQPWQFGHGEIKATGLWLKGLPVLKPSQIVDGREARIHRMSPGPERSKLRSVTYQGIADAMAAQWSAYLTNL